PPIPDVYWLLGTNRRGRRLQFQHHMCRRSAQPGTSNCLQGGRERVDRKGKFTATNAHSGNNGRAAILNNSDEANFLYSAGNAGNGGNPQPDASLSAPERNSLSPKTRHW